MADHGELLTKFDNIFGDEIEHEVVKSVLSSCDWDEQTAYDLLLEIQPLKNLQSTEPAGYNDNSLSFNKISSFQVDNKSEWSEVAKKDKKASKLELLRKSISTERQCNVDLNSVFISQRIANGEKLLILLRGLPGCGKTTLAHKLVNDLKSGLIFSTDDFFRDCHGTYIYCVKKLHEAHEWNKCRTEAELKHGSNPIIIDNTNLEMWEMMPYINLASEYGYNVELIEPSTPWRYNAAELAKSNTHGVSKLKIEEMKNRFKRNIDINSGKSATSQVATISPWISPTGASYRDADVVIESFDNVDYMKESDSNLNRELKKIETEQDLISFEEPIITMKEECYVEQQSDSKVDDTTFNSLIQNFTAEIKKQINSTTVNINSEKDGNDQLMYEFSDRPTKDFNYVQNAKCNIFFLEQKQKEENILSDEFKSNFGEENQSQIYENASDNTSELQKCQDSSFESTQKYKSENTSCKNSLKKCQNVDPKWLASETESVSASDDFSLAFWKPIEGLTSWDGNGVSPSIKFSSFAHTGAVPKRKYKFSDDKLSINETKDLENKSRTFNKFTQTFVDDFMFLQSEESNNWTLYGTSENFLSSPIEDHSDIFTSRLNKYSMTDIGPNLQILTNIKKFFPSVNDTHLFSVLDSCNCDFDDAVDVLLDEGYEISVSGDECQNFDENKLALISSVSNFSQAVQDNPSINDCISSLHKGFLTLELNASFASSLINLFGDEEVSSALKNRQIQLPLELCLEIYKCWVYGFENIPKPKKDEEIARLLQEKEKLSEYDNTDNSNDCKTDFPIHLKEIMDLEQAVEESKCNVKKPKTMASVIFFKEQCRKYPSADPSVIEDILSQSQTNEDAIEMLNKTYGIGNNAFDTTVVREKADISKQDHLIPDNLQEYRDEAYVHFTQQKIAFTKAQEAYNMGYKSAGAYFAGIANLHGQKYREANQRAAQKILEAVNSGNLNYTLDIHYLYVTEALKVVKEFLEKKKLYYLKYGGQTQVFIITGRGSHSLYGKAILKAAVSKFLKKSGYPFSIINPGMLSVSIS